MIRFIVLTFAFMGLGFYELSGGSDFEPAQWREITAPKVDMDAIAKPEPQPVQQVTKAKEITKPAPQINVEPQENPLVVLAAVPTTRRLVGASEPTPNLQKTTLGPDPSDVPEGRSTDVIPVSLTTEVQIAPDFRRVTGNRVNMRNGPGTQYSVVGKLLRDDEVEVLQDPGVGWVKLQVLETGRIGWMSAKLLTKVNY